MSTPTPWTRLRRRIDSYDAQAAAAADGHGYRASVNLANLQKLRAVIEDEIDREIVRAREQGATWGAIDYGSSKQAAQQRHAAAVRRLGVNSD